MKNTPSVPDNSFANTLNLLGDGAVLQELSDTLQEVTTAVTALRQKGEIILRLKLKPSAGGTIAVAAEISRKLPRGEAIESLFYPTGNGLSRNNPNQKELELRAVEAAPLPAAEMRKVS